MVHALINYRKSDDLDHTPVINGSYLDINFYELRINTYIDQSRASSLLKVNKDCLGIPSFWILQN